MQPQPLRACAPSGNLTKCAGGRPPKLLGGSTSRALCKVSRCQVAEERVQLLQLTKGLLVKRLLAAGYEDSEIRSMEREHDKARQRGLAVGQSTGAV